MPHAIITLRHITPPLRHIIIADIIDIAAIIADTLTLRHISPLFRHYIAIIG
jgi:hypothetical protein